MQLPILSKILGGSPPAHYLAVDLGTDVAKVAIFKPPTQLQKNPQILGRGRQKHGLTAIKGARIDDFDAVLETLDLGLEEAQLHAGILPKNIILGLSGGAIKNVGVTVRIKRQRPEEEIDEEEFAVLSEKIEQQTLPKAQELLTQLGEDPQNFKQIGTYFTGYLVDGAKVETPLEISGETLQTQVLHAFTTPKTLEQTNKLADQLNLQVTTLVDTTISLTSQYLEDYPTGIVVDLGGQVSEVVIFKERKILGNVSFNLGSRDLTAAIMKKMRLTFDEAEKVKVSFGEGHLDAQRSQQVRQAIKPVLNDWSLGLEAALEQFNLPTLPPKMLLVGDSATIEEVKSSLVAHPWKRVLPFNEFPEIEMLGNGDLALEALTRTQL